MDKKPLPNSSNRNCEHDWHLTEIPGQFTEGLCTGCGGSFSQKDWMLFKNCRFMPVPGSAIYFWSANAFERNGAP